MHGPVITSPSVLSFQLSTTTRPPWSFSESGQVTPARMWNSQAPATPPCSIFRSREFPMQWAVLPVSPSFPIRNLLPQHWTMLFHKYTAPAVSWTPSPTQLRLNGGQTAASGAKSWTRSTPYTRQPVTSESPNVHKEAGEPTTCLGSKSSHTTPGQTLPVTHCTHASVLPVPVIFLS